MCRRMGKSLYHGARYDMRATRTSSIGLFLIAGLLLPSSVSGGSAARGVECHEVPLCLKWADQAARRSKDGDLTDALRLYQLAYEAQPDPRLLFNIARLLHKQERNAEAASYYEQFLKTPVPDDEQRRKAVEYLVQIRTPAADQTGGTSRAQRPARSNGTGLMITGGLFTGIGLVSLAAGAGLYADPQGGVSSIPAGIILMANGAIGLIIGVPTLAVGVHRRRASLR